MREFRIRDQIVTDDSDAMVLADISHNHLGSVELCREMIRLAKEAGVDGVKLQKRGPSTYDGLKKAGEVDYATMREDREFRCLEYAELQHYAHSLGLHFIATAFDKESVDFLGRVDVDAIKIASGDVTNTPLLQYVMGRRKPVIVSTGGATLDDVRLARQDLIRAGGCGDFCFLHCTSEYPVKAQNINLRVIETYRDAFPEVVIGFSSHVHRGNGADVEMMAYLLGARIFEKHFTITPYINTGEHAFAMTPPDLATLCQSLKQLPKVLGAGEKAILPSEAAGILRLGKHLVYAHDLPAGHVLTAEDFAVEAPGNGVPPNQIDKCIGAVLVRPMPKGTAACQK